MTFFNLDSNYAWLYPAITVPLTIIVVGAYMLSMSYRNRNRPGDSKGEEESDEKFEVRF